MNLFWSILCLAGVWGFVACTVGFILQGFPARGVLAARPCLRWGAGLVLCLVLWLVGMSHA